MWDIKTNVISVVTWASRTISKQFGKYLNITSGRPDIKELHKTATLGAAHLLQEVLMLMYRKVRHGKEHYIIAGELQTPEIWFVPGL